MIPKEFDTITKADIEALVANAVAEGRTIEYKRQLPGGTDDEKKEFLADVSSFANAGGGDIIFGVIEKRDGDNKPTNLPEKAEGLAGINAGAEIIRLDAIIQSGMEPRIPGCRIRSIDGFASGSVLVIRIPKSWTSPHMVTFKNLSRFFSRTSAGKNQLDVGEIRSAFTASGDLRAKITAFRTERLGKIVANEAAIDLSPTPKIVLHLVPLSILNPTSQIGFALLENDPNLAAPIQNNSYNNRHNLDGFLSYNMSRTGGASPGYTQVFRSGAFEAVDADLFNSSADLKLVASTYVEQHILQATARYLKTAKQIGTPLPLIVMVSAFGLKGYGIATSSAYQNFRPTHLIDRDTLLFPDVLLEDYSTPADVVLKPIFDAFWQSAGFPACQHYTEKGRWNAIQTNY
jgi:hypothetical protein